MPTQIIEDVPIDEVGECIQLHIDAGATRVEAESDPGGATFTLTIEKK